MEMATEWGGHIQLAVLDTSGRRLGYQAAAFLCFFVQESEPVAVHGDAERVLLPVTRYAAQRPFLS